MCIFFRHLFFSGSFGLVGLSLWVVLALGAEPLDHPTTPSSEWTSVPSAPLTLDPDLLTPPTPRVQLHSLGLIKDDDQALAGDPDWRCTHKLLAFGDALAQFKYCVTSYAHPVSFCFNCQGQKIHVENAYEVSGLDD